MGRSKQVKVEENTEYQSLKNKFTTKNSINLNDLLEKRAIESRNDRKTNFIILLGASSVAAIIIALLMVL